MQSSNITITQTQAAGFSLMGLLSKVYSLISVPRKIFGVNNTEAAQRMTETEESDPVMQESHPAMTESPPAVEESHHSMTVSPPAMEESCRSMTESPPAMEESCPSPPVMEESRHSMTASPPVMEESRHSMTASPPIMEESRHSMTASPPAMEEAFHQEEKAHIRQLEKDMQAKVQENEKLSAELAEYKTLCSSQASHIESLQAKILQVKSNYVELKEHLAWFMENVIPENSLPEMDRVRDLEREKLALNKEIDGLISELIDLRPLLKKYKADENKLKSELYELKEDEKAMSDMWLAESKQHISLKQKMQREICQLREMLQDVEKDFHEQEERQIADLSQRDDDLRLAYEAKLQELVALMNDFQHPVDVAEQVSPSSPTNDSDLLEKLATLERANMVMHVEKQKLVAEIIKLHLDNSSLTKHNKCMTNKLTRVESQLEQKQQDVGQLVVNVIQLQENKKLMNKEVEELSAEVAELEFVNMKHQKQIKSQQTTLCEFQQKHRLLRDNDEKMSHELALLQSETEKNEREITHLKSVVRNFQASEDFLRSRNASLAQELAELRKSLETLRNLRRDAEDREIDSEEAKIVILSEGDPIERLGGEIAIELRQSVGDQGQKEVRDSHDILHCIQGCLTESDETLETPAPEVPSRSFWRRCAKGLLKVGLYAGVATGGALVPIVVLAAGNLDLALSLCESQLLAPFCHFQVVQPGPF